MNDDRLRHRGRQLLLAWAALIALMLSSLGSSYLKLGMFNAIAGLAIASVKTAIVVWLFMRIGQYSALARIVAVVGVATWLLLMGLSGVDYATRVSEPMPMQQPQQLRPLKEGGSIR